jgi:hypothetical protein
VLVNQTVAVTVALDPATGGGNANVAVSGGANAKCGAPARANATTAVAVVSCTFSSGSGVQFLTINATKGGFAGAIRSVQVLLVSLLLQSPPTVVDVACPTAAVPLAANTTALISAGVSATYLLQGDVTLSATVAPASGVTVCVVRANGTARAVLLLAAGVTQHFRLAANNAAVALSGVTVQGPSSSTAIAVVDGIASPVVRAESVAFAGGGGVLQGGFNVDVSAAFQVRL